MLETCSERLTSPLRASAQATGMSTPDDENSTGEAKSSVCDECYPKCPCNGSRLHQCLLLRSGRGKSEDQRNRAIHLPPIEQVLHLTHT